MNMLASSFAGACPLPFVREKILERSQQKRPEFPPFLPGQLHNVLLQEPREERLSQVLGILRVVAQQTHVGIERVPINATELLQRLLGAGRRRVGGAEHDAPMRGGKPRPAAPAKIPIGVRRWHRNVPTWRQLQPKQTRKTSRFNQVRAAPPRPVFTPAPKSSNRNSDFFS